MGIALAASAFGLLGIGAKTRNADGALTRDGKIALVGLLISGALAQVAIGVDFYSGEQNRQQANVQGRRLNRDVQRNTYPLLGITVDLDISLPGKSAPLKEIRDRIHSQFKIENCRSHGGKHDCAYHLMKDGSEKIYEVDFSGEEISSDESAPSFLVFRQVSAQLTLFRLSKPTQDVGDLVNLGNFSIEWSPDDIRKYAHLQYDFDKDSLSLQFKSLPLKYDAVKKAGVFSLADVAPGAVSVAPWISLLTIMQCGDECRKSIESFDDIKLSSFTMKFQFPKILEFHAGADTGTERCVFAILPEDVDDLPSDISTDIRIPSGPRPPCGGLNLR